MKQNLLGVARWVALVLSFPVSGLIVFAALGPATTPGIAAIGGLVVGLVVGAAEALALRLALPRWTLLSGLGLAAGSLLAALIPWPLVGAAVAGLAMAAAQLPGRPPLKAPVWLALGTVGWVLGWAVSLLLAISTEQGFVVFGSTGAVAFTLLLLAVTRIRPLRVEKVSA